MGMETWSSELVAQWLVNIGLGHFAAVLNADKPFTGRELEYTTVAELGKAYKIDKRPAKKIIRERDNALAYMHIKPVRKRSKEVEISYPFRVVHVVHVEYVPGKGLKGLPKEWKQSLRSQSTVSLIKKRESPKRQRSDTVHDVSSDEVLRWSPTQVAHWLQQIGMAIFVPEFEAADIDGRILISASYSQLAAMLNIGTDTLSQNLFRHIAALRGNSNKRSRAQDYNKENQRNSIQYSNIQIRTYSC